MKQKLVIHHSADSSPGPQFWKINESHKARGFPLSSLGFYVGYPFVIERTGETIQARALTDIGAHTAAMCDDAPCNLNALAVCMAGNYVYQEPTDEECAALYTLWKALNYPKIILHSDVKATACPGNFNWRNELQKRYYADLAQRLKVAVKALPRFMGTLRGEVLERTIQRLKSILHIS